MEMLLTSSLIRFSLSIIVTSLFVTKLKLFLKFIKPQNYVISLKSFKNYQLKICAGFSRIDSFQKKECAGHIKIIKLF